MADLTEDPYWMSRTRARSVPTAALPSRGGNPGARGGFATTRRAHARACVTTAFVNPTRVGGQPFEYLVAGAGPGNPPL